MLRYFLLLLFLGSANYLSAQKGDSLFVKHSDYGWVISHKVKAGETLFAVARRYHVPPAMMADFNNTTLQTELAPGKKLFVPVGAYNLLSARPVWSSEARPAYYKVGSDLSISKIAKNSAVKPKDLQQWNGLANKELYERQVLLIGWLLYDATEGSANTNKGPATAGGVNATSASQIQIRQVPEKQTRKDTIYVTGKDTVRRPELDTITAVSEGERLFLEQTNNQLNLIEEKGSAAFFKRAGASSNGIFFAFHNSAKRGTIIKIHNPGTGKTVYAKVIGAVPTTASYHNSILGLSSDAKTELGAFDTKAWVQVSYAP